MRAPTRVRTNAILTILALASAASIAGCIGGAEAKSGLFVKDALTDDVSAVDVTFTKAQAKPVGSPWRTVFEGKETIDLLSLSAADAKARLAAFDLPPGPYEGMRLAVSEVEVTRLDGTVQLLNVFGNVVHIAEEFNVSADGIQILVDFDLEEGVDLGAGTYTPVVGRVQTSGEDADDDGQSDFDDVNDDNDDKDDDQDDDEDGDGEDDKPVQFHGADVEEVCSAERQEHFSESQDERNETLAEAAEDRDETLNDPNATQELRDEAWSEYNATVAEAEAEHEEELAELQDDEMECVREEGKAVDGDDDEADGGADDRGDPDADDRDDANVTDVDDGEADSPDDATVDETNNQTLGARDEAEDGPEGPTGP